MPEFSCRACGVEFGERDHPPLCCPICDDERQYVPEGGQQWNTRESLLAAGTRVEVSEREPDLFELVTVPQVGIGQHAFVVRTPSGNVMWDVPGSIDDAVVSWLRSIGGLAAIVASHPHMYGAQVAYSQALAPDAGGATDEAAVPIYIAGADRGWVQRWSPAMRTLDGSLDLLPGVTVHTVGGHFPGSLVLHWAAGADARGVLLAGDTLSPGPTRRWVSFLRSYPNDIPLSPAVVDRVTTAVDTLAYDRIYGYFGNAIPSDAHARVRASADRSIAWCRGDFDHLT